MSRIELSLHERAQVEAARETLAAIVGARLADASAAAYMVGRLEVSLRSLLEILDADQEPARRCPAAHPEDPAPCGGPVVVTVLDSQNAGADGCELHAIRMLASITGGRLVAKPDAPAWVALRIFRAAHHTHPFPWLEGRS
ncbi:hypothetical protein ACFVJ4_05035 [Streptomyces sp. NPDC127178]|uniref:hypothetical protein n=1 Tax=unclassified Streptomyces TaxID=2593676 RepID=UPI00362B59A5